MACLFESLSLLPASIGGVDETDFINQGGNTMNANAQKLIDALRSGEFEQTTGRLKNFEVWAFCCLGVACELYRQAQPEEGGWHKTKFLGCSASLPEQVKNWLGFRNNAGGFSPYSNDNDIKSLVGMNDNGYTFTEIADLIESEPDGLFAD